MRLILDWESNCNAISTPKFVARPPEEAETSFTFQSTLSWFSLHGTAGNGWANLCSPDGSVQQVYDLNGDNYLNPGFGIPDSLTQEQYDRLGYRDDTRELHPASVFSGVSSLPNLFRAVTNRPKSPIIVVHESY